MGWSIPTFRMPRIITTSRIIMPRITTRAIIT